MPIDLPRDEFDILVQDAERIVIYDKKVDKIYEFNRKEFSWKFPAGSRTEIMTKLIGFKLF